MHEWTVTFALLVLCATSCYSMFIHTRDHQRIRRLEAAVLELNPGLGWDWTR